MVLYHDDGSAKYWGVNQIDKYLIERYLKYIVKGVYIECGASDGLNQSNTVILNYGYDWGGILIEPNPHCYQLLRDQRPNHPLSTNNYIMNCALVSHDYKKEYIEGFFGGDVTPDENGVRFVNAGEPSEKEFNDMMSGQIKTNHNYDKERFPDDAKLIEVPAKTLDEIFAISPYDSADFFSLDVEGYELEVLKGWSPRKYPIKYVLIEGVPGEKSPINEYMEQNNYHFKEHVGHNMLYSHNEKNN
jgi:FkbM family methyltransferase